MHADQPNILLIQADQLAASALGAYRNPVAKTPHIDALAGDGAIFDAAYCNFPLCAPSRFSMLSGQLASAIGAYDNGAEFAAAIPTFAHYLRHLGYQTCLSGKMHFVGADQLHGFEERLTTDIYPADFGWTGDWTEVRPRFANDQSTFHGAGVCLRNPQMEYDEAVCFETRRKLYDLARGNDARPFLLVASFTHPHDPFQCRPEHWERFREDDIPMPAVDTAQADMDPYSLRLVAQYGLENAPPSAAMVRRARHAYYGSVSYFDDLVGQVMRVLDETGLADDTVVVLTSDHGEMLGEHGLWYKKVFFEEACRVPLIIRHPDGDARRVDAGVSLVDLLPTLLQIGGDRELASLVEPVAGHGLLGLVEGADRDRAQPVYAENLAEGATTPLLMVREDRYKYVYSAIERHQLYDLDADPQERDNRIDDPALAAERERLEALVQARWDIEALHAAIVASQRRRLFLREVAPNDWDFRPADGLAAHCLRADKIYSDWAYAGVVGLRQPGESES